MRRLLTCLAAVFLFAACGGDDPVGPSGTLRIIILTNGVDEDVSYQVRVGGQTLTAEGQDTLFAVGLRPGTQNVSLTGVDGNCAPSGGPTRAVAVTSASTSSVTFEVSCVATTGSIAVVTSTSGGNLDADGYTVRIGSGTPLPIPITGVRILDGYPQGDYSVVLSGLATNCTVSGQNPRTVHVNVGGTMRDTAATTFEVTCTSPPGSVRVFTQTVGSSNLDPDGYTLAMDGETILSVPTNGNATASGIPSGMHSFRLEGIASTCGVAGLNPRSETVDPNSTLDLVFDLTCGVPTVIEVSTATTGADFDANGYRIRVTAAGVLAEKTLAVNATARFDPLPPATYTVALDNLAANCEVAGGASRSVVASGGTIPVSFAVSCATLGRIAYAFGPPGSNIDIFTARADGSGQQRITGIGDDTEPAWSSTGKIAFRSNRFGNGDIYVMNEDGSGQTRLTNSSAEDFTPAWSPDGTRIAFVSQRDGNNEIYVMNADGSNVLRITNNPAADSDPAWSPDGTRIAFARGTCDYSSCHGNIHLVNPDGQNLARITETEVDGQPSWSPDGTRLVFSRIGECTSSYYYYYACERDIYMVSATGGDERPLAVGSDVDQSDPSWSPTGAGVIFGLATCGYYDCLAPIGIRIVRVDGSDAVDIVTGPAMNPTWRRP